MTDGLARFGRLATLVGALILIGVAVPVHLTLGEYAQTQRAIDRTWERVALLHELQAGLLEFEDARGAAAGDPEAHAGRAGDLRRMLDALRATFDAGRAPLVVDRLAGLVVDHVRAVPGPAGAPGAPGRGFDAAGRRLLREAGEAISEARVTELTRRARLRERAASLHWRLVLIIDTGLIVAGLLVLGAAIISRRQTVRRRSAEVQERRTAAELRAVLNSLGEGVLVVDRHGAVTGHNPAAERLLGVTPTGLSATARVEILRFRRADGVTLFPPDELPLSRALRGEPVADVEVWMRNGATGEDRLLSVTGAPIRAADGTVQAGVVVLHDITEARRAAEELRRSNAELEQFAYVASHDLQEPLRMVSSYTQLLAKRYRGRLDADADEFIGYAVEGAARMRQLIQDLLAYSRVGSRPRELRAVPLGAVLDAALANLRHAIDEAGAVVTHDPLPEVHGDGTQLTQVFQNLVGNAVKYRGADRPRIHVSAVPDDGGVWTVAVRDNGIGIEPQYVERVFGLFQRLHNREAYPGTGIGLTIARKIVERHGGQIWVDSAPGRGSVFFFTLPEAPAAAGAAATAVCTGGRA